MENKNYCKICNEKLLSVSSYNRHLKSKSHLKNLWESEQDNPKREKKFNLSEKEFLKLETGEKFKLDKKENLYICEYCDYETNDSGHFSRHKLTEKHLLNVARVKAGLSQEKTGETIEDLEKIKENLKNDLKTMKKKEEKEIKFIDDNTDNPNILMNVYKKKLKITQNTIEKIKENIENINFKIISFEDIKEKSGEVITIKEQKKRMEKGTKNKKNLIEQIKEDEEELKIKETEFEENATGYKNFKKSMKKKGIVIDKEGLKKASKFQAENDELKEKLKNPLKYELNSDDIELYKETVENNKIELEKIAEENNITIKILFQFTGLINDLEANINDIKELKENLKENNEKYKNLFG
jgi:hypothetical protein